MDILVYSIDRRAGSNAVRMARLAGVCVALTREQAMAFLYRIERKHRFFKLNEEDSMSYPALTTVNGTPPFSGKGRSAQRGTYIK